MRWYDLFSWTYDRQLEATYRPFRDAFLNGVPIGERDHVLVLGCGTGQDFDRICERLGPNGCLTGLDRSTGMLARARSRAARLEHEVTLLEHDLTQPLPDGVDTPDVIVASMVLSAVPDARAVFEDAWARLAPGGWFGLMDAHAETRTFQTRMVEVLAQADLNGQVWRLLEAVGEDVEVTVTEASPAVFGGRLVYAVGRKPLA